MGAGCCSGKVYKGFLVLFNLLFWVPFAPHPLTRLGTQMPSLQISGIGLLLFGIWILVDPQRSYLLDIINMAGSNGLFLPPAANRAGVADGDPLLRISAYIFMGAGVLSIVIGFLGCCGALKEIQSMLAMVSHPGHPPVPAYRSLFQYAVFLLLILTAEVAAGVLALAFKSQVLQPLLGSSLSLSFSPTPLPSTTPADSSSRANTWKSICITWFTSATAAMDGSPASSTQPSTM